MLEMNAFAYQDEWPSWMANAFQRFLSVAAFNISAVLTDSTHVKIPAGPGDQAATIAIGGLWRWMEADVGPIAHPGGAAGVYPMFVTAKNNAITNSPVPFSDHTDYTFGARILAPGATPAIVPGTVDVYRHVFDVHWDGVSISAVDQLVPPPLTMRAPATWRLHGPYPLDSSLIAAGFGSTNTVPFSHNLNVGIGHIWPIGLGLNDSNVAGARSDEVQWRWAIIDNNTINFIFKNLGPNGVRAFMNVLLLTV